MNIAIQPAPRFQGELTLPPDKAICHRVLFAAALAEGSSEISPWPDAEDCQRTLELVQRIGVTAERSGQTIRLHSRGMRAPSQELFCGESGTTLRLAAGVLAGQPFISRLTAAPSLSRRPMRRIVEPLERMGARVDGAPGAAEVHPPLTIHGRRPLQPVRYEMPVASAQVKSAVLFAGTAAEGPTTVVEPYPTRDHTERMLRHCGLRVERQGSAISVTPGPLRAPGRCEIPGDFSSAAFFLVAASCVPGARVKLRGVSLNPTRTGLLPILARMGARIAAAPAAEEWEPRGLLEAEHRPLRGTTVSAAEAAGIIDELPILMVAASCAEGLTRLEGLGELRVKETDRIRSMVDGLRRLGAQIQETGAASVEIIGGKLTGTAVESAGDHRTAMSLAVAGLIAQGPTVIRGAECVSKSFPGFFDALASLAGSSTVKTVDSA